MQSSYLFADWYTRFLDGYNEQPIEYMLDVEVAKALALGLSEWSRDAGDGGRRGRQEYRRSTESLIGEGANSYRKESSPNRGA